MQYKKGIREGQNVRKNSRTETGCEENQDTAVRDFPKNNMGFTLQHSDFHRNFASVKRQHTDY